MQVLQGNIVEGQLIDGVWALLGAGRPLLLLLRFLLLKTSVQTPALLCVKALRQL